MRAVFLVIDGMADRCIATKEDLAAFFRQDGADTTLGYFETCPKEFPPDSMVCLLTLLGVPETQIPHTGRAWLEALGAGFQVEKNGLAFRCSLVQVQNGKILSPCAAGIVKKQRELLTRQLSRCFPKDKVQFYPLEDYKSLLVLRDSEGEESEIITHAPHEAAGRPVREAFPQGSGGAKLLRDACLKMLEETDGKFLLLPWGQSAEHEIPGFTTLHGELSAAVCQTGIARGVALAMGMETPELAHATSDTDTDLQEKLETVFSLSEKYPFVFVHVNGADEAAHRRNAEEKTEFLKRVSRELVFPLLQKHDLRILITSDHATLPETGGHAAFPQPFLLAGCGKKELGVLPGTAAPSLLLKEKING